MVWRLHSFKGVLCGNNYEVQKMRAGAQKSHQCGDGHGPPSVPVYPLPDVQKTADIAGTVADLSGTVSVYLTKKPLMLIVRASLFLGDVYLIIL